MLPPVDNEILLANPKFALLHKKLTTQLLNPDGSTRNHPTQTERDARASELHALRLKSIKAQILRDALSNLPLTEPTKETKSIKPTRQASSTVERSLPAELIELIILLTLHLATPQLNASDALLLIDSPAYTSLPLHLDTISILLSAHLSSQALPLTRLLHPNTNASFLHRSIPSLPTALSALLARVSELRTHISTSRSALTTLTVKVLRTYTSCAESIIRILEQSKHGSIARHSRASAEVLSLQAATAKSEVEQKAIIARGLVYTPDARLALKTYAEHLRDGRARLGMRKRDAEAELSRYGVGRRERDGEGASKQKVMQEIAKVWGEMEREMEDVRRDIERLRGK